SVTFTPTDSTDYKTATAATTIVVTRATPTITWPGPASIVYGTPLSSTQLDATANTAGTFTYSPAAGTILPVATQEALSVPFTPSDTTDYTGATGSTTITVLSSSTPPPTLTGLNFGATVASGVTPVAVGGLLYFAAADSTHGTQLWASNGTSSG